MDTKLIGLRKRRKRLYRILKLQSPPYYVWRTDAWGKSQQELGFTVHEAPEELWEVLLLKE